MPGRAGARRAQGYLRGFPRRHASPPHSAAAPLPHTMTHRPPASYAPQPPGGHAHAPGSGPPATTENPGSAPHAPAGSRAPGGRAPCPWRHAPHSRNSPRNRHANPRADRLPPRYPGARAVRRQAPPPAGRRGLPCQTQPPHAPNLRARATAAPEPHPHTRQPTWATPHAPNPARRNTQRHRSATGTLPRSSPRKEAGARQAPASAHPTGCSAEYSAGHEGTQKRERSG